MEDLQFVEKFILDAKNIDIIPTPDFREDSFPASLGVFFSLKQLGKNVNLIAENYPEKFRFLTKNLNNKPHRADFQITIPEKVASITDVFYEKNEAGLDLFLKTASGRLSGQDILLKNIDQSDLAVAVGFKKLSDLKPLLRGDPDFIIDIDNQPDNEQYGQLNLLFPEETSLSESVFQTLNSFQKPALPIESTQALLAGLVHATDNFKTLQNKPRAIETAVCLMADGGDLNAIHQAFYGFNNPKLLPLLGRALEQIQIENEQSAHLAFTQQDFLATNSTPQDLRFVLPRLKSGLFPFQQLLLIWEQGSDPVQIHGVFYSPQAAILKKVKDTFSAQQKGDSLLFKVGSGNLEKAQKEVLRVIHS